MKRRTPLRWPQSSRRCVDPAFTSNTSVAPLGEVAEARRLGQMNDCFGCFRQWKIVASLQVMHDKPRHLGGRGRCGGFPVNA